MTYWREKSKYMEKNLLLQISEDIMKQGWQEIRYLIFIVIRQQGWIIIQSESLARYFIVG